MKFSNYLKSTLLFFLFISIAQADDQTNINPMVISQIAEKRQDVIEMIIKTIIEDATALDIVCEDLALDINNKAIQIHNKDEVIANIKKSRELISLIKNDAFADIDEIQLASLLNLNNRLIDYIAKGIDNGFKNLQPFTLPRVSITNEDITFENLFRKAAENSNNLKLVQQKAKTAGLSWYNRLYRNVDDYVLQPSKKYHLDKAALVGGITGLLALNYWYHSESENKVLRKLFGWAPHFLSSGGMLSTQYHEGYTPESVALYQQDLIAQKLSTEEIEQKITMFKEMAIKHPMKWAGQFEHWFFKHTNGFMPLATLLTPFALSSYTTVFSEAKKSMSKRVTQMTNFLKGGEYRNKPDGINDIISNVTFDDIIGKEHAKEIARKIFKYIEDPERFARKNLVPEQGYLLYGPTRTGKSHFAKAVCGEIQKLMRELGKNPHEFGFYEIKADKITEVGFDFIMHLARNEGPCVIFIDEIDLLDLQRIGNKNMLSQFLSTLSGFMTTDPKKQVIILAATNKPENLDFALRQRGRFGKSIFFDLPTLENRTEFLYKRLNELSVDTQQFNIEKLALETTGCTYEDLNAIIKAAFQRSKILGETLSQELLEFSFDEEVRNIISHDEKQLTDKEIDIVAAHQAAQAAAYILLETADKVAKVTIQPIVAKLKEEAVWTKYYNTGTSENEKNQKPILYGKVFTYRENDTLNILNTEEKLMLCKVLLAGEIAEKMLLGTSGSSYNSNNKQTALNIIQSIVFEGLDKAQLPKQRYQELLKEALSLLKTCEKEITTLLEKHKEQLTLIVKALKEYKSLSGEEVTQLLREGTLKKAKKKLNLDNLLSDVQEA